MKSALLCLALLCGLVAAAHADSGRRLFATKRTTLTGGKQCGGLNTCDDRKDKPCKDAAWPKFRCEEGYECARSNEWFWQCAESAAKRAASEALLKGPKGGSGGLKGALQRYTQCGGNTGTCAPWGCEDCAWPTPCEDGYACNRLSEAYYQCDPVTTVKKAPKRVCTAGAAQAPLAAAWGDAEEDVEEEEEEEAGERLQPQYSEALDVSDILGEPSLAPRPKCGPAVEEHEIEGTYVETVALPAGARDLFKACCRACSSSEGDCAAFQVNEYGNSTAASCDLFSTASDIVPSSGVTAGVLLMPSDVLTTAG